MTEETRPTHIPGTKEYTEQVKKYIAMTERSRRLADELAELIGMDMFKSLFMPCMSLHMQLSGIAPMVTVMSEESQLAFLKGINVVSDLLMLHVPWIPTEAFLKLIDRYNGSIPYEVQHVFAEYARIMISFRDEDHPFLTEQSDTLKVHSMQLAAQAINEAAAAEGADLPNVIVCTRGSGIPCSCPLCEMMGLAQERN